MPEGTTINAFELFSDDASEFFTDAGAPLTDNVLKCTLKPLDPRDYQQSLSADQMARLRAVFPSGVCDWSKPGVGEQVVREAWRRF